MVLRRYQNSRGSCSHAAVPVIVNTVRSYKIDLRIVGGLKETYPTCVLRDQRQPCYKAIMLVCRNREERVRWFQAPDSACPLTSAFRHQILRHFLHYSPAKSATSSFKRKDYTLDLCRSLYLRSNFAYLLWSWKLNFINNTSNRCRPQLFFNVTSIGIHCFQIIASNMKFFELFLS